MKMDPCNSPEVLATDSSKFRLYIKETLKIVDLGASKSLNGNCGSFDLRSILIIVLIDTLLLVFLRHLLICFYV
jgi:hypothetical protein